MKNLDDLLKQAISFKKNFQLDETIKTLKECLELDTKCTIASAQIGLCSLIQGNTSEAEKYLQKAYLDLEKKDLLVNSYYAAILTANGKNDIAKNVIQDTQDIEETYLIVAEMLVEKKNFSSVVNLLDILTTDFIDANIFKIPSTHYRLIRLLSKVGFIDIAEILAESLVEQTPTSWEGLAAKASIEISKNNTEEAYNLTIRALQRGGASNPLLAAQQHLLAIDR
ncbi:MAG: hypothetical protein MJ250_00390 [Alphaproteobacteria bacterium]|nr:hypothetical protein [Alphaproteobacteria bacterium]